MLRSLALALLALFIGYTAADAKDIKGIDVSKYQGDIDWHRVKASGVKFAWIKATQGSDRVDDKFHQNWRGAAAAGIPRGAYHFVNWCDDPRQEMANFFRTVPRDPRALPPVLDVEPTPHSKTCKRVLHPHEIIPEIRLMLDMMEAHYGVRPKIYTGPRFYKAVIAHGGFDRYDLWIASYSRHPRHHIGDRRFTVWQHSDRGRVKGIRARVDINTWNGDADSFRRFASR